MAASVTLIKRFTYRGNAEDWSNTYHLDGTPADATAWKALADSLWALEQPVLPVTQNLVHAYGHHNDDENVVWSFDYSISPPGGPAGTFPITGTAAAPGDAACWARWDTGRTTSNGKKIYLRKYFHGCCMNVTGGDVLHSNQKTALQAFATALLTWTSSTVHFAGPDGVRPPGPGVAGNYITTRTLKRRGRRPPP